MIELLFWRARREALRNLMERNIVAAGGKIHVLRVRLPDNLHAEKILIEALGPRYVSDLEGDMAHPFQSSNTAHARTISQCAINVTQWAVCHLPGTRKSGIVCL